MEGGEEVGVAYEEMIGYILTEVTGAATNVRHSSSFSFLQLTSYLSDSPTDPHQLNPQNKSIKSIHRYHMRFIW
jgi:hypothetical protein